MLIGATIDKTLLDFYGSVATPKIVKNNIMRVFPSPANTAARWDDARMLYCKRVGALPFISAKTDGNAAAQDALVAHLADMPDWVTTVYVTNRHEPEGDQDVISIADYRADFTALLTKINTLPAPIRSRVKFGQVLTKQWTESSTKGHFDYGPYDTGLGDFLGIDCYMDTNSGAAPNPATSYRDPDLFLQYIKAYKNSDSDTRPRIFPEFGAVGLPGDTTGSARAAWIQAIHDRVKTWNQDDPDWDMPWDFIGWCWWNHEGTGGSALTGIGTRRWFNLDRRHNGQPYTYTNRSGATVTDPQGGYTTIANSLALAKFNQLVVSDGAEVTPDPDEDPDPVDPGEPDPEPEVGDDEGDDPDDDEADPDPDPTPDPDPDAGTPSNVLIVTPEATAEPPRVRLDLTWVDGAHLPTLISRYDQSGDVTAVRGTEDGVTLTGGSTWTGYDYETPFRTPFSYGVDAPTLDQVQSLVVQLDVVDTAWLRHPGIPSISTRVNVEGDDSPVRKANKAVLEPLGRRLPVVITDGRRKAKTSTITFRTFDETEADRLLAIVDDLTPLLLDIPPSWGWGIRHQYMALGDLTETRTTPNAAWLPYRDWTASYEVVDRPTYGTTGPRTWVNVLTEADTWKELRGMYGTWNDVINGRTG